MLPLVVLHTEVQAGLRVFVSLRRYSAWTGLWLCKTRMASSTLNHCLFLPIRTEREHGKVGSQNPSARCLMWWILLIMLVVLCQRGELSSTPCFHKYFLFSAVKLLRNDRWEFKFTN